MAPSLPVAAEVFIIVVPLWMRWALLVVALLFLIGLPLLLLFIARFSRWDRRR
jgi:ABC-type multidrug transport system permease subunit